MMEKGELENLSYKDLVRHLIEQNKQTNACFNALDERERIIQRQMERVQSELTHKANDTDMVEIKNTLKSIMSTSTTVKEVRAENKADNKWIIATAVTITIFVVSQIINYFR